MPTAKRNDARAASFAALQRWGVGHVAPEDFTVTATPSADMIRTSLGLGMLAAETQMVMAMRIAGMAGAWSVLPSENQRMIDEKGPAFLEAAADAWMAAISGKRPDQVLDAWTTSLRRKTGGNARRLMRRGPRMTVW